MLVGRISVMIVAVAAIAIAWTPNNTILNLVGNAWAGFGAAFGPLVILSLYWKGLSRTGAISGMVAGALTVILWIVFAHPYGDVNDFFNLYEIVPGFIVSLVVTILVSNMTQKPGAFVEDDLNQVVKQLNDAKLKN